MNLEEIMAGLYGDLNAPGSDEMRRRRGGVGAAGGYEGIGGAQVLPGMMLPYLMGTRNYDYSGPSGQGGLAQLLTQMQNNPGFQSPALRHFQNQGFDFSPPGLDTQNPIGGPNPAPGNINTGQAMNQPNVMPTPAQPMGRPHTQGWRNYAPGYSAAAALGYGTPNFGSKFASGTPMPPGAMGGEMGGGGGRTFSVGGDLRGAPAPSVGTGGTRALSAQAAGGSRSPSAPGAGGRPRRQEERGGTANRAEPTNVNRGYGGGGGGQGGGNRPRAAAGVERSRGTPGTPGTPSGGSAGAGRGRRGGGGRFDDNRNTPRRGGGGYFDEAPRASGGGGGGGNRNGPALQSRPENVNRGYNNTPPRPEPADVNRGYTPPKPPPKKGKTKPKPPRPANLPTGIMQ